jgi:TolB-like protein
MSETRKLAAILVSDVAGYSRLAGADEDRVLARLRALRSDLIDPTIAVHHGRVVKRTGDGAIVEFRSIVDAVRCAIEVQNAMVERNAGVPEDRRIEFRVGIHLGDVVEETDGDLMGDGVNIAARLEGIAKPGAICLSEDAYRQVKRRLDFKVTDLGPRSLKNIAEPVHVYSLEIEVPTQPKQPAPVKSAPPRLSIVVLPFANLGGDPEQEYFVDGVTESLTTDLSRISGSFVIARNTAFTYKGKAVNVKQIGGEPNVQYVLKGSVQRSGHRMRVNAQLIDAESGSHLWVDRFDKSVADLFELQDEIVVRLANSLNAQLTTAQARRAELTPNPDSMDLYFQGLDWFNKGMTAEHLSRAFDFLGRALAIDPSNVDAMSLRAGAECMFVITFYPDDGAERLAVAEAALTKALSLAPGHAGAHLSLGLVFHATKRPLQCIAECERALALNRNLATAHPLVGLAKYCLGRTEETEPHVLEALRLSPRDTFAFVWLVVAGYAAILLGDDERAVAWFRQSIETNRNYPVAHFALAAALANLGRLEEAKKASNHGLELNPIYNMAHARMGALSDNSTYLAGYQRYLQGLQTAGLPAQ